jgi:membrane protein/epoxyqueuosine reductase
VEPPEPDAADQARSPRRLARLIPLLKYLVLRTESHAYCAAIAFFALVAFYPFCSLLLSFSKSALAAGTPAHGVLVEALEEYYPEGQDFLLRNLEVTRARYGRTRDLTGVFWILLGTAGVFIPLEAAFNRIWRFPEHRPYWKNQAVGLLLTAAGCCLAILFVLATAALHALIAALAPPEVFVRGLRYAALRLTALGVSVAAIFLFYRILPNGPVRSRDVVPAALLAGIVAEAVRWVYLLVLPWLELPRSQGPYYVSISFVLLAYVEAFVVLGGAFLAAAGTDRKAAADLAPAQPPPFTSQPAPAPSRVSP